MSHNCENNPCNIRMVKDKKDIPLMQQAAKKTYSAVGVLAKEGEQYKTDDHVDITVRKGAVYINILNGSGNFTDFWKEFNRLKQEGSKVS